MRTHGIRLCRVVAIAIIVCGTSVRAARGPAKAQDASKGAATHTHTYFIAADEVTWDYVPGGIDGIAGKPFHAIVTFEGQNGQPVIKPVRTAYLKCLYREYTGDTFNALKPRSAAWQHLGMLGPLIRGEVGDTIRVVFRNNCSIPASIHPHGVFYARDAEGAPYDNGQGVVHPGDEVAPGGNYTYVWNVPERAGPGPGDPNSVLWMYHSHIDEERDFNTGLIGPMIITARGQAKPDGTPKGVDREVVVWFAQVHEEDSWYVDRNLPTIATDHAIPTPLTPASTTVAYPYFVTFSINGYSHGSMPLDYLTVRQGEHVRWYLMSGVNDFDFHTPHWHGNTVLVGQMRTDVTSMAPMQMVVAEMVPDDPGTWLFHCHVAFHNAAGMTVRYRVLPSSMR